MLNLAEQRSIQWFRYLIRKNELDIKAEELSFVWYMLYEEAYNEGYNDGILKINKKFVNPFDKFKKNSNLSDVLKN